ncbi:hypothetical protein [Mycoplasmopsis opalescens]|uniref:hypothetical protein n=1 Tax=Mycoplasmopsis opalescens TaxID=114886 RepID=UPI0004A6C372|nr:hypothetical protein [Mycoplasmopsis opalescens]
MQDYINFDEFSSIIEKNYDHNILIIALFSTYKGASVSQMYSNMMKKHESNSQLLFFKVFIEEHEKNTVYEHPKFSTFLFPTIFFIKYGTPIKKIIEYYPDEIYENWIEQYTN